MDKKVLTEKMLRKLVRRVIKENENMLGEETPTEEDKTVSNSHPLAEKTFNDVNSPFPTGGFFWGVSFFV